MLYIRNDCHDPHYNLALEEYAFKNLDPQDGLILLWQNEPSVIIGRYQNTIEEINSEYIKANGINVVRRITGGGAVYHDLGNLNFSFIVRESQDEIDFRKFTEPVIRALAAVGVEASHTGRNDITIDEKKFSGNAQCHYRGKTLHHGTILFDSALENVQAALHVKADKIESKGIKSVRSRVTNIADYLEKKVTVGEFRDTLLALLFEGKPVREYHLSDADRDNIRRLMAEKYLTWEWNYGSSPPYNIAKSRRFTAGGVEVRLNVEKGIITACKIYGDFFSSADIDSLAAGFVGLKYREDELVAFLAGTDISPYLGAITKDEMLECLLF